jgi:hypothetical protein
MGILWVRSYIISGNWQWLQLNPSEGRSFQVGWGDGGVTFFHDWFARQPDDQLEKQPRLKFESHPIQATDVEAANAPDEPGSFRWLRRLGFSDYVFQVPGYRMRTVGVPFWLFVLLPSLALAPALRRGWVRQRRKRRGHCLNCGYDLRASAQRCPECGTALAVSAAEGNGRARAAIAAIIVFVAVGSICWLWGDAKASREVAEADRAVQAAERAHADAERINVPPPPDQAAWHREHDAIEAERRRFISVDFVRLSEHKSGITSDAARLWPLVQYQSTVRTQTPFDVIGGVLEFYDSDHRLLGCVGLSEHGSPYRPWLANTPGSGSLGFALDEATRSALAKGKVTARYRAGFVRLPDGTKRVFGEGIWEGAFIGIRSGNEGASTRATAPAGAIR